MSALRHGLGSPCKGLTFCLVQPLEQGVLYNCAEAFICRRSYADGL